MKLEVEVNNKNHMVLSWSEVDPNPANPTCVYLHRHEITLFKKDNKITYEVIDVRGITIKKIIGDILELL